MMESVSFSLRATISLHLIREPELQLFRWATSNFLILRNCEINNTACLLFFFLKKKTKTQKTYHIAEIQKNPKNT
jgi:hypothetical protein